MASVPSFNAAKSFDPAEDGLQKHLSMTKDKTKQPMSRVASFSFKKIKSNLKSMNPLRSSSKDKSRSSDLGDDRKSQKHRPMTNEEAIQNASMDMRMIREALARNEGQMTEDQTRSYRNSLRGTNYGRTVYGDHGGKPKSAYEGRGGAEDDGDDIFDQSGSSENNESTPPAGEPPQR